MRTQFRNLLNIAIIIFSAIILISCKPPDSVSEPDDNIQDIRVQVVEPERTTSKVEQFPLPNCGGTDKLAQSLGTFASISKRATVGTKATVTGGGEVQIPETAKLKLEIQVERAYQSTFESANSRIDSIEMSALAGTHVVYTILWENQSFNSIVQYSTDGKVYEVPYTYQLSVPKIDTSYQVECLDDNGTSLIQPSSEQTSSPISNPASPTIQSQPISTPVDVSSPNHVCPLIVIEGTVGGLPIAQTKTWSELTAQGTTKELQSANLSETCSRDSDNEVQVFVGYWSTDPKYLNFRGSMTPDEAMSLVRQNPNQPVIIVPWGE